MARARYNSSSLIKYLNISLKKISDKELGEVLRGAVVSAYKMVLKHGPQYTGHMIANTTIYLHGMSAPGTDELQNAASNDKDFEPVSKRHPKAIGIANLRNSWVNTSNPGISGVYGIGFEAEPSEAYYSYIEAGGYLRSINEPGMTLAAALEQVRKDYRTNLSRFQASKERI